MLLSSTLEPVSGRALMHWLLTVTLLTLPSLAGAEARKTLEECIEIALRQQPTLRAAAATVAAGRERVWETAAAYLPQVSANYLASRRHASSGSLIGIAAAGRAKTFPFYSTGMAFSQVLFDFGQNLELIHAAQASAEALAADADTQHDTVVFNVQQAYFALLAAYRLRDVAEETVAQNEKHVDLAQGRHDVGLAPRFDVTNAQVQLATAELNRVTARNNVSLGRETLRNALGLLGPLDFDIVDSLEQPRSDVSDAEALDLAYANRPELKSLAAQERADIERIKAIEKDYLPKLTLTSNVTWSGSRYPLQETWNFGGLVNLSIFNGGLTTAQVGEAKANLDNLRATEDATRQNVTLEVRQALLNLRQAAESIGVADKGLQQARENLTLAEGRYKTGVGNIIELTDAQVSLATAEASRVQALVGYRTALAALERSTAHRFGTE
ncbi:MAG: TolC family protein [Deltaproteobacteria bacterium]|nr:MAG: TolC family protein [Deltaproteobacteria bacterium]